MGGKYTDKENRGVFLIYLPYSFRRILEGGEDKARSPVLHTLNQGLKHPG